MLTEAKDVARMQHLGPKDVASELEDVARVLHPSDLIFRSLLSKTSEEGAAGGASEVAGFCLADFEVTPERAAELERINAAARAARLAERAQAVDTTLRPTRSAAKSARAKPDGYFVKGPIPLAWLLTAANLGGGPAKAGTLIWFAAGLWGSYYEISLQPRLWQEHFSCRQTFYRALEQLQTAGLIDLDRGRGRSPIVSIRVGGETCPTLNANYAREGNFKE